VGDGAARDGGDERDELRALVSDLRQSLLRHWRAGRWATSATASPRGAPGAHAPDLDQRAFEGEVDPAPDRLTDGVTDGVTDRVTDREPRPVASAQAALDAVELWPIDEPSAPRPRKTLEVVRAELGDCQRCKLASTRQTLVFGAGAADAALVFVGEAPGADEDRTGEPFVGRAGELLDKMIEAMGWSRSTVYIANLLKCRPPGNRNPEADEARECRPFLLAQLDAIAPRIIVSLGRPASNALLGNDAPISALRGRFHQRLGVKIMPTFHPAYLLRDPSHKREAWEDLKQVMAELERIGVIARR
jgi:uracil-DNA glycosylase